MDSPVSRRTPGERNAIKSRGLGHSELTSVGNFETGFFPEARFNIAATWAQNKPRTSSKDRR
jgi:hypothetical protein